MDVALLNPQDKTAIKNQTRINFTPLNLMYFTASLERVSFSVKIDDDLKRWGSGRIASIIEKLNPLMVDVTPTTATIKPKIY